MFTISNYYNGINIGSVSVNFVSINETSKLTIEKRPHLANPKETLNEILKKNIRNPGTNFYEICGSFGETSEIVAVERAIKSYDEKFDVVLSLGGEAIVLYVLDKEGHITNVLSHDKCAAGSGEFFIQQIDRLGISLEKAIELAKNGKKTEIASRCSVHCKSDITHKLNRGEASVEDLLTSVLASMVNKIKGLIIQSRVDVKRLLVIGGLSLNEAFIKLLNEEFSDVEVILKDVSSVFEAYGAALLARDSPISQEINLKITKSFSILPSLKNFTKQVTIFEPTEYKKELESDSEYILGVDVGSTTTKAVLLDPKDYAILASFYGRTNGNPVEATRKCIKEMLKQVGNQAINLVGVTGSGRQLVGAYLGTSSVYNEISAHARGAVFFDENVDTIFEIGGQDSKYMYLQNSVPVDYAMNATCSAGTGSFLEESAKGDLGIDVLDISKTAIEAENPVLFKADCAAFINTDIRTALQEDYGRENIVGGLVYSIVDNYLNKVKGSRPVGNKVFFQGGVAKNHSVGYAFAEATGKQIIIPPHPELMGAFGIAIITNEKHQQQEIKAMVKNTTLELLIQEELKHLGSFKCRSCKNYCQIERYEVGGRKFSFGGSCSKYEHVWRDTEEIEEKEDLIEIRNDLILRNNGNNKKEIKNPIGKIGIPRALLTHSLYPLMSTFLEELNYEVVLSGIDDEKELMTNASFCYPVQILHGAVLDLVKKDIKTILLPHVHNMPKVDSWAEGTFCPITQASPYFISTAFNGLKILKPVFDFEKGYDNDTSLINMAVYDLNIPKEEAKEAYRKAVKTQKDIENKFLVLGRDVLAKINQENEIGIIIVGRSYNAFPPETSLKIPKKFVSMGFNVIPFDFIEKTGDADIPWYFGNYVKAAIDLTKQNKNLFLVYINSFSCTIDAFMQNYVRTEMDTKPYLMLELDAHTADAGIQTRLEAFLEIIRNYQKTRKDTTEKPFQITQVKRRNGKVVVINSDGEKIDIKDPRVKLFLPSFSKYHTDIGEKLLSIWGFNTGETTDIEIDYLVKGYRYSSGKECIPLPSVLGQLLTLIENRKPGEIIGMYMIRGGSPCAVYSYFHFFEQFIEKNKIRDVFIYRFDFLTRFLGVPLQEVLRYAPSGIILGDLILEIESALHVVGKENSLPMLHDYWKEFLDATTTKKEYRRNLRKLIRKIRKIPRTTSPIDKPKVLVSGDFFVRFSPFFLGELREIYSKHGIMVKSTDLFELGVYGTHFNGGYLITKEWNRDPNQLDTIVRAAIAPWKEASRLLLMSKVGVNIMLRMEQRLRRRFEKTGLLYAHPNDLGEIIRLSSPWISRLIFGEAIPTIGKGIETLEGSSFDSLILTGPFNCLPYKISQAILKPIYLEHNMPFLVYDVDMSALTPNMKRLIHANIEQIKRRREEYETIAYRSKRARRIRNRMLRRAERLNRQRLLRFFGKSKYEEPVYENIKS